jgi:uncharacterized protein
MSKPSIGTFHDDSAAGIDLPRLLETRMLIQANSGGGKSWAIRRLLEQTAGHVQQLVIDPEGEFATLREKHDYVIAAAHDGDALAHPKTAQILARRLLETGVSAILDIYDLKAHERQAFVRIFCETLVNAPKALWQPTLIVLDEAHVFCPEAGKAESAGAVIDLATRGRKRGFALIAATQRLAKLHKDTAAELLNKLVGRTGLDVDVKRAGDELGMTPREAMEKLRPLSAGEFFAFGPALSLTVRRLKVGAVQTTHPKAGDRVLRAPPKPTAAIVAVLPKLADLPKEAEAEARSVADLKRYLANARRELTQAKNAKPGASNEDVKAAELKGYERGREAGSQEVQRAVAAERKALKGALHQAIEMAWGAAPPAQSRPATAPAVRSAMVTRRQPPPAPRPTGTNGSTPLGKCETKILTVLSQFPEGVEVGKLTLLTGYRKSGGFLNSLSTLRTAGLMEGANTSVMRITDAGMEHGPFPELPQGDDLLRYWLNHPSFGTCERKILTALSENPDGMTAEEICEATNYAKSGGFLNSLSSLRTAGVLVGRNTETMRISGEIL